MAVQVQQQMGQQMLQNTTAIFGANLPAELIVQPDGSLGVGMRHMPSVLMAYTDNIPATPVSEGVTGVWCAPPPPPPHHQDTTTPPHTALSHLLSLTTRVRHKGTQPRRTTTRRTRTACPWKGPGRAR